MRRDYNTAIKAAVNGLYDGSIDGCQKALWDVLEALDSDMAELMHEDEEVAFLKVNQEDDDDDEKDTLDNDVLFDDEDTSDD